MNTYRADVGKYNAVGQGLNNLASAFMGPDTSAVGEAELRAQQARQARESARLRAAEAGREEGFNTNRALLADSMGAEEMSLQDIMRFATGTGLTGTELANTARAATAGQGLSDDRFMDIARAGGQTLGVDESVSVAGQADVSARNQTQALAALFAQGEVDQENAAALEGVRSDLGHTSYLPSLTQQRATAMDGEGVSLADSFMMENPQRGPQGDLYNAQADLARARAESERAGPDSDDPQFDPLNESRRVDLAEQAEGQIVSVLEDMGVDPADVPRGLSSKIASDALAIREEQALQGDPQSLYDIATMLVNRELQVNPAESGPWYKFGRGGDPASVEMRNNRDNEPLTPQGGSNRVQW